MVLDIYGGPPPVVCWRGGGGSNFDQLKKADEDEMFRNLQADVWAYETEGAFN